MNTSTQAQTTVTVDGEQITVVQTEYLSGGVALLAYTEEGYYGDVSTNLPDYVPSSPNAFFVKGHTLCGDVVAALVDAKMIAATDRAPVTYGSSGSSAQEYVVTGLNA